MDHVFKNRFVCAMRILLDKTPVPRTDEREYESGFYNMGYSNITSVRDICDYFGIGILSLCLILLNNPNYAKVYRRSKIDSKLDVGLKVRELLEFDYSSQGIGTLAKLLEFSADNLARTSLKADKFKVEKLEAKERARISREILAMNKSKNNHSMQYDFARFASSYDEETIRRVNNFLMETSSNR